MNLKEKTIAALEKQVELLLQGGLSDSQVESACKTIMTLTNLLTAVQNV